MDTAKVEVKSKGEVVGTFDYEFPVSLDEALDVDGDEKIYKLYAQQRKIAFLNAKRRELTGGGLPKALMAALKAADPEMLQKIAADMGLDLE